MCFFLTFTTQNASIVETKLIAYLSQIFPNPARSQFTVNNTDNADLYLYNIVGQEVLRTYSKAKKRKEKKRIQL